MRWRPTDVTGWSGSSAIRADEAFPDANVLFTAAHNPGGVVR